MSRTAGVILLLLAVSQAQLLPPDAVRLGCQRADVGFLLDMSGTMRSRVYRKSIRVIQALVREFNVRLGRSRAGLVTFNNEGKTEFDFDMHPNAHEFNAALRRLPFKGGRTRIDHGLDEATMVLYNQRYNDIGNQKYLFVVSDGAQSKVDRGFPNLKARTWLLRHQRVKIIVIAVGRPHFYFLNQLVQLPEYEVIRAPQHERIPQIIRRIYSAACSQAPAVPTECERMADFGFLLDQSSSIGGPQNFRFETNFVKNVLDNLSNVRNRVRASVLVYGSDAEIKIKLNEFNRLEDFKAALDKRLKFEGSTRTRIDKALRIADQELFTKKNGDRPDVPNYLVLVTDGRQNSGSWITDQNFVEWYAKPLWRRNVTIFAIGVALAEYSQLKRIAGPKGTAIYRKKLNQLNEAVETVIPKHCRGCHKKLNLGFVVDASGTSKRMYQKMKRLVHHTIEGFKQQKNHSIASVVRFSAKPYVDIHFGQYDELFAFQAEVDTRLPFIGGNTFIDLALRSAEEEFKANANPKLPKVLIVITDGKHTGRKYKSVLKAVEDLKKQNIHTVAVKVGNCKKKKCKAILEAISGDPRKIVPFKKNDNIMEISEKIANIACPPDVYA